MARRDRDRGRGERDPDEVFDFETESGFDDLDLDEHIDFGDLEEETDTGSGTGSGTPRPGGDGGTDGAGSNRAIVLGLIILVIAVGLALSAMFPASEPVATAGGGDVQQVWFCPDTPGGGKVGSATISVVNLTESQMEGTVTYLSGDGAAPPDPKPVTVKAFGRATVSAADSLGGRPGAAIVTLPPGAAAVAEQVTRSAEDPKGVAAYPCASTSSTEWYFPSGSTKAGRQQSLVLVNPSQDAAIVDVTFRTEAGEERPEKGSGVSLPPRSQTILDIDANLVIRRDNVATVVRTERGRVVAAQRISVDGAAGFGEGLGAPAASNTWYLTGGRSGGGQTQSIGVFNTTGDPGTYTVSVDADQQGQIVPPLVDQELDPGVATTVDMSEIGSDAAAGYEIETTVPSVVDQIRGFEAGRAYVEGVTQTARRWALPASSDDARADTIEVLNPGSEQVDVDVYSLRADGSDRLEALGDGFALPGGSRVSITLSDLKAPAGPAGIVVAASDGVVAARSFAAAGDRAVEVGSPLP
ncbi:MAG: DUF5719 family protein [Acidimicrobiia bacterium]